MAKKELIKIDKDYVFKEIGDIYDLIEEIFDSEEYERKPEILERMANLQAYCKEGE